MRRRISAFLVVLLVGFLLVFANLNLKLQNERVAAEADKQSHKISLNHVYKQQKDESTNTIDSSSTSARASSQQSYSPSVSSGSMSNTEQIQYQSGYAQLTGPIPYVVRSLPTTAKVVFITVDDGWYPSESVLEIMRKQHLPISTFLIEQAAQAHLDFWKSFLAAGGEIENHTFSHPDLTKESPSDVLNQIETAQKYLISKFSEPTLIRPPYGSYNQSVCQAASHVGLKHVIIWNATMSDNGLQTYNGKALEPGSIILLHWVPNLDAQLHKLIIILGQEHFGVASLHYALDHPEKFPITKP